MRRKDDSPALALGARAAAYAGRRNQVKSHRTFPSDGDRPLLPFAPPTPDATPVWFVSAENWETVKSSIGADAAAFAERCGFKPKAYYNRSCYDKPKD